MPPKKAPKKSPPPTTTSSSPSTSQPNWPPFKPLLPTSDLSLETLIPSQIILIRNFWTSTLCKTYVNFLSQLPLVTTPGQPKRNEAMRVNDRFQIQDEGFAERLWESGIRELVMGTGEEGMCVASEAERKELWGGEAIGLNPNIRIYRYKKGQYFNPHYDETNALTLGITKAKTTWTLLLYLTSQATGCEGGETVFYPENPKKGEEREIAVGLEMGMVLLHRHGRDCMLHEGREVKEGEKWVIRTDLCVKK